MKMAKASKRDLDMALDMSRMLEEFAKGYFPKISDDDKDIQPFSPYSYEDCLMAMDAILEKYSEASLFRVVFGMATVLSPDNEVVDPDSDVLELHPKYARIQNERDELLALAEELLDTELAGMACAGSHAPVEDVVGRLQIAVERIKGGAACAE